ncbi:tRNA (cmo5U34)-methyltransferase [Clostridium collagenovorans DSM 3089]|uniref:tRNA (Cmo5U34)-methyltransferase n=1 Tax=Clostridium collagenovorans DSM 3089 TaxID=1121306 RepID=A0A1M5Y518_9CLOT|nr:class I SAM-dependent methyltransferase [Clostridium collagenovorans]SHI07170.1 tRNA (cmo5U34)-methyltransferase [Clostridium collagenovorans DSM 3089]
MEKEYEEYLEELKSWLEETRDTKLESMDQFFEERVETYDEHMESWDKYYKVMGKLIPKNTKELLDIGCGTGLELEEIFKHLPAIRVTGIDLAKSMLDKLENKYKDKNTELICGDYFTTEFGEGCFDTAISFQTLHHFRPEKKIEVFRKLYSSLKNGGCYIECDYIARTQEIEDLLFLESDIRREKEKLSEEYFVHFDTPLTLEHEIELIKKAGFEKVEFFNEGEDKNTVLIVAWK